MRRIICGVISLFLVGCTVREQVIVVVTATPIQNAELSSEDQNTPAPTYTDSPTKTPRPTSTPMPSWSPVAIGEIEQALRDAGYRRYPWTTDDGLAAFDWIRESAYEQITTWEDGSFELQVLHDTSPRVRLDHMEQKFKMLDRVLPTDFMDQLRRENESYNQSVKTTLSGTPDDRYAYGDEWQTVWAEYYTESMTIGGYDVWFSVWWWQSTCPSQYLYCYYEDFPGLEFSGDSSFSFYTIYVAPNTSISRTSPTT